MPEFNWGNNIFNLQASHIPEGGDPRTYRVYSASGALIASGRSLADASKMVQDSAGKYRMEQEAGRDKFYNP